MKFAADIPVFAPIAKNWKDWGAEIEKKSNNRVKFTFYFGNSLIKGEELRKGLLKGMCDIAIFSIDHDPAAYKLNSVMQLPILGIESGKVGTQVWKDIIAKFPEVENEYKGTKISYPIMGVASFIHTTKKEIQVPEDLQDIKIAGMGSTLKTIDVIGASPVSLMPMEFYMGLERGVADGMIGPYPAIVIFRVLKLTPYHNDLIINYICQHMLMSSRTWNKLPADIQKIFEDSIPAASAKDLNAAIEDTRTYLKKN